jgi:hypothetical protein
MIIRLALAFLSSFGFGLVLAQEPAPKVDRSGEPALIKLMNSLANRKSAHYYVSTYSRDSEKGMFFEGNQFDLTFGGPKRIRLIASNMWGDGRKYVSDGKALLLDYLDISQGAVLKDIGKNLMATDAELDAKGSYCLVTTVLFQGADAIEEIASKDSPVRVVVKDGISIISVQKSDFGNLNIVYREERSGPVLIRCEYDNWDYKQSQHEKFPDWVDAPEKGTLDLEICLLDSKRRIRKNVFDTSPPKGLSIKDERKKEKEPHA